MPSSDLRVSGGYFIGQVHSIFLEKREQNMVVVIGGSEVWLGNKVLFFLKVKFLLVEEFYDLYDGNQHIDHSDHEANYRR